MKQLFDEPLPFSDYVILYFVDMFGLDWLDFYYVILVGLTMITIGGWVVAFYAYSKCNQAIYEAVEDVDVHIMIKESEKLSYIALAIETGNMPSFSGIERFIDQFFRCCKISGLSFNWLQKLYIGKNCLNQFRQDNGYKEGTYIKNWATKEDNVVMVEILDTLDNVDFDTLYKKLNDSYKKLNNL